MHFNSIGLIVLFFFKINQKESISCSKFFYHVEEKVENVGCTISKDEKIRVRLPWQSQQGNSQHGLFHIIIGVDQHFGQIYTGNRVTEL